MERKALNEEGEKKRRAEVRRERTEGSGLRQRKGSLSSSSREVL